MPIADIFLLLEAINSLIGLIERNQTELTPEQREALHDRTRSMVERATALVTG
jgi:hypothetical protein